MADTIKDIRQYSTFHTPPSGIISTKSIYVPKQRGDDELILQNIKYIEMSRTTLEIESNDNLIKFGYCCEPVAALLPIYINDRPYQICKTGMFEYQKEDFGDDPPESLEEFESIQIPIVGAPDPIDIEDMNLFKQTFDYVVEKG